MYKGKNSFLSKKAAVLYAAFFLIGTSFFLSREAQQITTTQSHAQEVTPATIFSEKEHMLIPDFPQIPLYPGAQIDESYKKVVEGKTGYEAEWLTTDERQKVLKFYTEALPQYGWTLDFIPEDFDAFENQFIAHKGKQKLFLTVEMSDTNSDLTEIAAEIPLY